MKYATPELNIVGTASNLILGAFVRDVDSDTSNPLKPNTIALED